MNKNLLSVILSPYFSNTSCGKNISEQLDLFVKKLLEIAEKYPNFRFNLKLSSYFAKNINSIYIAGLTELQQTKYLELIFTGFTEPFISLFPRRLTDANISKGLGVFEELFNLRPTGFSAGYSNFENFIIPILRNYGFKYYAISSQLIPMEHRNKSGIWLTEHLGETIALIPYETVSNFLIPPRKWFAENIVPYGKLNSGYCNVINCNLPIDVLGADVYNWLELFAKSLDTLLINHELALASELVSTNKNFELQYVQSSAIVGGIKRFTDSSFLNYIHTFDSIGLLQRRILGIVEKILTVENLKLRGKMLSDVFLLQDINNFLPPNSGYIYDNCYRAYLFSILINLDKEIDKTRKIRGGRITVTDVLQNGNKSILLANKNYTLYIDHKNGGSIFEIDYKDRNVNILAVHNEKGFDCPEIVSPVNSYTSFKDYFLTEDSDRYDFLSSRISSRAFFKDSEFDYQIKKTRYNVKAMLSYAGDILIDDAKFPVSEEKVFSLENDNMCFNFSYRFSTNSLLTGAFRFAFEIALALPGTKYNNSEIIIGGIEYNRLSWDRGTVSECDKIVAIDYFTGIKVTISLQKPAEIWFMPVVAEKGYQGSRFIIVYYVELNHKTASSFVGKFKCDKVRKRGV